MQGKYETWNSLPLFFIIFFLSAKLAYIASVKYTLTQFDTLEDIQNKTKSFLKIKINPFEHS